MNRTRPAGRAALAFLILLASCAAFAAPKAARRSAPAGGLPRYGVAVYSDLCVQDGEFGGQRVTFERFAEVDTVVYEYTAGGLSWPLVASDVNIDPRGRQLYFTVRPPGEEERTIAGKVSADGRMLTLEGGYCEDASVPMKLAKVSDFGRVAGACKPCPAPKSKPALPAEEPAAPDATQPPPARPPADPDAGKMLPAAQAGA